MTNNILVIGAAGQIGTELVLALRNAYGNDKVIATDLREVPKSELSDGPYEQLDVLDKNALFNLVKKYDVSEVYLLAALLSATAEKNPALGWDLNMNGLSNVLDLSKDGQIKRIFWPSSIAVFGPHTPKIMTPQRTIMEPTTVYGITKVAGESWCEYYAKKYKVDVRSIRYPGIIGYKSAPGGGTTDYAVHIFHEAIKSAHYSCFLSEEAELPMMYMPDAVKATLELMEAPEENIKLRTSYNIAGFSFTPDVLAGAIRKHIPEFKISYDPDYRDGIAKSWPSSIDDSMARKDWGWKPDFTIDDMVEDMLVHLREV
ncbi:MAG TPA: NAD-dependent epimerase/dehydratase family protein, partial [Cryomorphaceae bacterium]|nr:NAD-dependent epimerase/dehydratase family protein [Cryomorphaceae bacterium]